MEILIDDIPEEGLTIHAETADDTWLQQTMRSAFTTDFETDDQARLTVTCLRINRDIDIAGVVDYSLHCHCDRCLKRYQWPGHLDVRIHLSPLHEREQRWRRSAARAPETEVWDDLEFGCYEGDRFVLGDIVREQLILSQPMKHLCAEDCLGLCPRCGQDLNNGPCGCQGVP